MYTCYEVLDFLSTRFFDHHHPKSTTCALPRRKGSIVPASARLGDWKWIAERRIDPLQGWGGGGRGSGIPSAPVYVSHSMALDPDRGRIELLSRSVDPPTHTQKKRREGGSGTGSKEATSPPLPRRRQIVAFAAGPKWITAVGHPAFPLGRLMKGFHEGKAPRPPDPYAVL
jgi:hypothetical protein